MTPATIPAKAKSTSISVSSSSPSKPISACVTKTLIPLSLSKSTEKLIAPCNVKSPCKSALPLKPETPKFDVSKLLSGAKETDSSIDKEKLIAKVCGSKTGIKEDPASVKASVSASIKPLKVAAAPSAIPSK